LDPQKTTIAFNSEWLGKFDAVDLIRLAATHC
jgi:tyrosyl-tRNA synthetase